MAFFAETRTIDWVDGAVRIIDQRLLPHAFVLAEIRDYEDLAEAIRTLAVRGAPALGVAGALGVALAAKQFCNRAEPSFWASLADAVATLRATRPTAVNLFAGIERAWAAAEAARAGGPEAAAAAALAVGQKMIAEEIAASQELARRGAELLPDAGNVLTHCNTGSLATVYYGTALGAIRAAVEQGKQLHVWVDETRPRLQGARLTAWECQQLGIPYTLITDSMAAWLMRRGQIDAVIVGADRIAANGDTANKIGTYAAAVLARAHRIPFYVAAPTSSIDFATATGEEIPIEERDPDEVATMEGVRIAPDGAPVYNPAFDVTPAELIDALITERGIARPPSVATIAALGQRDPAPPPPEKLP